MILWLSDACKGIDRPINRNSASEEKQARVQSATTLRGEDAKVTKNQG